MGGADENVSDAVWRDYMRQLQDDFMRATEHETHLFTTDSDDLFTVFLAQLPPEQMQYHNCHACRDFIAHYGGLVRINADGAQESVLWFADSAPEMYRNAVATLAHAVARAPITGVHYTSETTWGKPLTNRPPGEEWTHFAVAPAKQFVFAKGLHSASQVAAAKREDFRTLTTALNDYALTDLETACTLLETDALYRSNAVKGVAVWLFGLKRRLVAEKNTRKQDNLIWQAVATAPAGWCHPRSTMIGSLLDDLAAKLPFAEVERRFREKMHPLQYQRAQVAPKAGQIAAAESVIEKMGLRTALMRRFARLDELPLVWRPAPVAVTELGTGVFASVAAKPNKLPEDEPALVIKLKPIAITWERFAHDVLPQAQRIDFPVTKHTYAALCGPVDPNAPVLFQWGNPYNWYRYYADSEPRNWLLQAGLYRQVTGVVLLPWLWSGEFRGEQFDKGVLFALEGCVDETNTASALFPGQMTSDLHGIRASIDAYSAITPLSGKATADACGVLYRGDHNAITLRVLTERGLTHYRIDRWN